MNIFVGKLKSKKKLRSKKGVSLVELIVGMAIIVIVFAATLGGMVGGYTTTVKNADQDREAVTNASVNEALIRAIRSQQWTRKSDVESDMGDAISSTIDNAVHSAAKTINEDIVYVPNEPDDPSNEFPVSGYDYQYTIIPDCESTITSEASGRESSSMSGVIIRTYSRSSAGTTIYDSFVPYHS